MLNMYIEYFYAKIFILQQSNGKGKHLFKKSNVDISLALQPIS